MLDLLKQIFRSLVDHPDEVKLTEVEGERTVIYEIRCNQSDLGKVIGKSGKTIGSIRTLMSTIAAKQGRRAMIEVVE